MSNDQEHARARKNLSPAFSQEALRAQEPLLQGQVRDLIKKLDEQSEEDQTIDLNEWYSWVAFDMITDNSFGEAFNCILEPSRRAFPIMISGTWKIMNRISLLKSIAPSLSLFWWFPVGFFLQKTVLQSLSDRLDFDLAGVKARIASPTYRGDILSSIVQHNKHNENLDDAEIMANASLFVIAGSETVATLLSATTYLLTQNPEALSALAKQIRENYHDDSLLTIHNLTHNTYLTACIEEALRLFPPVPEGLPRVTPPEGDHIGGHWVPGGVSNSV